MLLKSHKSFNECIKRIIADALKFNKNALE